MALFLSDFRFTARPYLYFPPFSISSKRWSRNPRYFTYRQGWLPSGTDPRGNLDDLKEISKASG
ncbi:MAG: hypothetical protein V3T60_01905, partial [Candidatus Binatia bacterium]